MVNLSSRLAPIPLAVKIIGNFARVKVSISGPPIAMVHIKTLDSVSEQSGDKAQCTSQLEKACLAPILKVKKHPGISKVSLHLMRHALTILATQLLIASYVQHAVAIHSLPQRLNGVALCSPVSHVNLLPCYALDAVVFRMKSHTVSGAVLWPLVILECAMRS